MKTLGRKCSCALRQQVTIVSRLVILIIMLIGKRTLAQNSIPSDSLTLTAAPVTMTEGTFDSYRALHDPTMHSLGFDTTHDMTSVISGRI